jgi:hypothetical protein
LNAGFHQAHEEWFPCQFFLYPAQQPQSQVTTTIWKCSLLFATEQ